MKKLLWIVLLTISALANAQSPAPEPDTVRDPVKQTDPEVKQLPPDLYDADEMVRIDAKDLPPAVLESLKSTEYKGWKKSVVYKYKADNSYLVEVRDGGESRTYHFNKNGKRIEGQKKHAYPR